MSRVGKMPIPVPAGVDVKIGTVHSKPIYLEFCNLRARLTGTA